MRHSSHSVAAVIAFALVAPAVVAAQRLQTREGFWISFGPGGGSASFDCRDCNPFPDELKGAGYTFHVRLGGSVSPRLLLGGEIDAWSKSDGGIDSFSGITAGAAYYYPSAAGGLFLKGGIGFTVTGSDDGVDELSSTGFGVILGAGYDVRVAANFSITPVLNLTYGGFGDYKLNSTSVAENFRQTLIEIGVGFTFH